MLFVFVFLATKTERQMVAA